MSEYCPRCRSTDLVLDPRYPWLGRIPVRCRRCGAAARWLEFRTASTVQVAPPQSGPIPDPSIVPVPPRAECPGAAS